jgi:hypothetical protein
VDVDPKFFIKNNDTDFPPITWGMKLGQIVKDIRNRRLYNNHKIELESIGINYERKSGNQFKSEKKSRAILEKKFPGKFFPNTRPFWLINRKTGFTL